MIAPIPSRGILLAQCCICRKWLPSRPIDLGDPAEGMISHGYCESCAKKVMEEIRDGRMDGDKEEEARKA